MVQQIVQKNFQREQDSREKLPVEKFWEKVERLPNIKNKTE